MRWFSLFIVAFILSTPAFAHHPDRENQPVRPYFDLIGPLGTRLPMSYRREFNRPRNITGKIAYYIAPSSQEAMAWHRATHKGYYEQKHHPRMITHYFYPKPWEALRLGARESTTGNAGYGQTGEYGQTGGYGQTGEYGQEPMQSEYDLPTPAEQPEMIPEPVPTDAGDALSLEGDLIE